ncbi:T9SS type A sorting domain-containing protein [Maribellus mangrovi]|uniref:T9SS type A sorting domain-containing protein n=1 Tax=Maribellus mangrovi TaxID=3133146 RepID=UPI0030EC70DE
MKTLLTGIFAMLITSVALASGNLKVNLATNDSELAVVEISNAEMVNYEIELFDEVGNKLYEMNTQAPRSELKKRYDFSNLEDGVYWYHVRTDNEEVSKKFSLSYGEIEVMDIRKTIDPYFHQDGENVKLSYLNYEKENVSLYIYDNRTLLKKVKLGNDLAIHKGLDLSQLNRGEYKIVLTNDFDIYEHRVVIN